MSPIPNGTYRLRVVTVSVHTFRYTLRTGINVTFAIDEGDHADRSVRRLIDPDKETKLVKLLAKAAGTGTDDASQWASNIVGAVVEGDISTYEIGCGKANVIRRLRLIKTQGTKT